MSLVQEWNALEAEGERLDPGLSALSAFDSIGHVEGVALTLLCASDVEVRRCAQA